MFNDVGAQDPTDWDMGLTTNGPVTAVYDNPFLEPYFVGNIDTYGPRGNSQDLFELPQYIPEQYLTGNVAQSWSFQTSPLSLTITLKQGIMWTGNPNIGMASRELTAADCAFAETRKFTNPSTAAYYTWIKDCVTVSKYVFQYDFNSYQANWEFMLLYGGGLPFTFCPESANAPNNGGHNWKNAVGTGPFVLTDFVDGSSVTYSRNPNYWGTTTINGKQYQEPFINTLVYLIIADPSTQLAALQTGKIDLDTQVSYTQASFFKQQSPKMIQEKWLSDSVDVLKMNRLAPNNPVSNLQVRQALCEAIDFNSIANNVYGGGDVLGWPVPRGIPSYTSLTDQSAAVQALFSDNPTQAKQLLTSAGYPNGFTTSISIDSSIAQEADEAQILASNWAKIGVTLQIASINSVALQAQKSNNSFGGMLDFPVATANPLTPVQWYQNATVGASYAIGEPLETEADTIMAEVNQIKQQAEVTQFCKDALLDAGVIPMTNPYRLNCYWPWLENYYGEIDGAYHSQIPMIRELWINQSLKTSLR